MNKITQLIIISVAGVALTACRSSSNNESVGFTDLNNTGSNGYKVNMTLDFDVADDPTTSIDYYFCTDTVETWDFFAYTSDYMGIPLDEEPDFDYGELIIPEPGVLIFQENMVASTAYGVLSETGDLQEGQTYTFVAEDSDYEGTVTVNSISDFNCSIAEPIPEPE